MNVKTLRRIASLSCLGLAAGCAVDATTQVRKHSLAELYKQADQVKETAEPYVMGVGDGIGVRTYGNFLRGVQVERVPELTSNSN